MPRPASSIRRTAVLSAATALLLTGCGGSSEEGTGAPPSSSSSAAAPSSGTSSEAPAQTPAGDGGTLTVTGVDFGYELEGTALEGTALEGTALEGTALGGAELAAGDYEIEFVNDGGASHDVRVELDGEDVARSEVIPPGETTTFRVTLEPGEYVFYCSVGNHRGMGMEVPVTVR